MAVVKYAVSMVIAIVATAWAFQFVSWSFELWPTTPIYKLPLAAASLPIASVVFGAEPAFVAMNAFSAVLVIVMHRENIKRLINGTEADFKPANRSEKFFHIFCTK